MVKEEEFRKNELAVKIREEVFLPKLPPAREIQEPMMLKKLLNLIGLIDKFMKQLAKG
jgi:hypothetical protein